MVLVQCIKYPLPPTLNYMSRQLFKAPGTNISTHSVGSSIKSTSHFVREHQGSCGSKIVVSPRHILQAMNKIKTHFIDYILKYTRQLTSVTIHILAEDSGL